MEGYQKASAELPADVTAQQRPFPREWVQRALDGEIKRLEAVKK